MKLAVLTLLACASLAYGRSFGIDYDLEQNTAYGYFEKYGIPFANQIRQAEEAEIAQSRIMGGSPVSNGQLPYQAGLIVNTPRGQAVCSGALVSATRVLTAAHCWFDGRYRATMATVVLGSNRLFSGGARMESRDVAIHGNWNAFLIRNDISMIRLPMTVTLTNNINVIALPSRDDFYDDFWTSVAVASGFGRTGNNAPIDGTLNSMEVKVIHNAECSRTFAQIVTSNLCTSGAGGRAFCQGDSGGPLVTTKNNRRILIGVASFGHRDGCQGEHPSAYTRVTYFIDWINRNL